MVRPRLGMARAWEHGPGSNPGSSAMSGVLDGILSEMTGQVV